MNGKLCVSLIFAILFIVIGLPQVAFASEFGKSLNLPESLFVFKSELNKDRDNDGLNDWYEFKLAEYFEPLFVFDSDEASTRWGEPVMLFQVRPFGCVGEFCPYYIAMGTKWRYIVFITYAALWQRDGGYGPSSACPSFIDDSHDGDNNKHTIMLSSFDGQLWEPIEVDTGPFTLEKRFSNIKFSGNWDQSHIQIYLSAHKHHDYFNTDNDHKSSVYGDYGCSDDVNGQGNKGLPSLYSYKLNRPNNVGEPESHDSNFFINQLDIFDFPGQNAWSFDHFISEECASIGEFWRTDSFNFTPLDTPPKTPSTPSGCTNLPPGASCSYSTHATDPDGDKVMYVFDWGDGTNTTATPLVNSGTSASTSHTWTYSGTYSVRVKAWSGKFKQSDWSSYLKVVIDAQPSKPSIPSGPASGRPGISYSYSTSATDPEGDEVRYTFRWGDGTTTMTPLVNSGMSASKSHTWAKDGTYHVYAYATDSKEIPSDFSDDLVVTMKTPPPNKPSTPSGPTSGRSGISYSYSTTATDPDGDQVKYTFDWGDGKTTTTPLVNSGKSASASHTWTGCGTYYIKAYATCSKGASSELSDPLKVSLNTPPKIPTTPSGPISGRPYNSYSYSTTSATNLCVDQRRQYTFMWGDGTTTMTNLVSLGTSASASHSWTTAGTYHVSAKARDLYGGVSDWSSNLTVVINNQPNKPSVPSGPASGRSGISYSYCIFTADPDGDQVKYTFDWGDGTTTTTPLVNSGTSFCASHSWTTAGTYHVGVKAWDSNGAESGYIPSYLTVVINTAPNTPSTPSGLRSGRPYTSYSYSTSATDPYGDRIQYTFFWGDGSITTTALVDSGTKASESHTWTYDGTYHVYATASNSKGDMSDPSGSLTVVINTPPYRPSTPSGPASGRPGTTYSYSTSAIDPHDDKVKYTFDWGDGTTTVTDLVNSGTSASKSHKWTTSGTYNVTTMASNSKGGRSDWSKYLTVKIV